MGGKDVVEHLGEPKCVEVVEQDRVGPYLDAQPVEVLGYFELIGGSSIAFAINTKTWRSRWLVFEAYLFLIGQAANPPTSTALFDFRRSDATS